MVIVLSDEAYSRERFQSPKTEGEARLDEDVRRCSASVTNRDEL